MSRIQNRLFVGNISFKFSEEDLRSYLLQLFGQYGTVRQVQIPYDKENGRIRGIAFVTMGTEEGATKALQNLDGENLYVSPEDTRPRQMRVDYAKPIDDEVEIEEFSSTS